MSASAMIMVAAEARLDLWLTCCVVQFDGVPEADGRLGRPLIW